MTVASAKPASSSVARALATLALILTAIGCSSEGAVRRAQPAGSAEAQRQAEIVRARMAESRITVSDLQVLNFGFADRYATLISAACEVIVRGSEDPNVRRTAAQVRASYITAMYDIVTGPDPLTQLADLALVVTLQSQIFIDDDLAGETFGAAGDELVLAIRRSREEAWRLLARVFTNEQLDNFDRLIWTWRRDNPHLKFVGYIRVEEFAKTRAREILNSVQSGGGFLAPVNEATRAVNEARLFGERAFFISKRIPMLIEMQVDVAKETLLASPAVRDAMDAHAQIPESLRGVNAGLEDVGASLDEIAALVPAEREAIFAEIDARLERAEALLGDPHALAAELRPLVESGERIVADLRAASESLNATVGVAGALVERVTVPADDPRFAPFDIDQYTAAASQLASAAQELRTLLNEADAMVASENLTRRLDDADDRIGGHLDRLFWRAAALIGLFFALLLLYRLVTSRIGRKP